MFNVHLSYKPPNSWRILFQSGGCPRQFSCLKNFRALVVPNGGCHKGIILQVIMTPTGVLPNVQSCLIIKGDVMGASARAPIQRNSMYVHTVRRSIYKTIRPKHPNFPILRNQRRPQVPASRPCDMLGVSSIIVQVLVFIHVSGQIKIWVIGVGFVLPMAQ